MAGRLRPALAVLVLAACQGQREAPGQAQADVVAAAPAPATPRPILGITVGQTLAGDVVAILGAAGIQCEDASMMAAMAKAHGGLGAKVPPEVVDRALHGEVPPAAAGMPSSHAAYLDDPALQQVRLSCGSVAVDQLGDGRAGVSGRLLVVADTDTSPVRMIAYQRTYQDRGAAVADARAMFAALGRVYGPPRPGADPLPSTAALRRYQHIRQRWRFAGAKLIATLVDLGATGVSVSEQLELRLTGDAEAPEAEAPEAAAPAP